MNKANVLATIRASFAAELAAQLKTAAAARDEATSEESRPENKYDTRSLEASYLAGALAQRILALRQLCAFFETWHPPAFTDEAPIAVGALISLAEDERSWLCLLVPRGGRKVTVDGAVVTLLSPAAPLGRALLGAVEGDEVEFRSPRGARAVEISEVW